MRAALNHTFPVPPEAIDVNGQASNFEYLRWMQGVATMHPAAQPWPGCPCLRLVRPLAGSA